MIMTSKPSRNFKREEERQGGRKGRRKGEKKEREAGHSRQKAIWCRGRKLYGATAGCLRMRCSWRMEWQVMNGWEWLNPAPRSQAL